MAEVLHNTEEVKDFAQRFISGLTPQSDRATVVGLYGELGAGKTTFTKAIAEVLGVKDTVASPTFVIMKFYEVPSYSQITNHKSHIIRLIHIDAYRLEKSSELANLGWQDIISDPENLVLIEWPEKVEDIMPEHVKINFTHVSENEREVEIN
jgi:tRNA threonylcarbamoyladenosine biosynthesis protein TsaE